jgi:hypothetical protein
LGEELLRLSVADLRQHNAAAGFTGIPAAWLPGGSREERARQRYQAQFNPATYMLALEELVVRTGIALRYDTRFCAAHREDGRITHVIVENKDGRSAIACSMVIDATGDADVCYVAGEETTFLSSNVPAAWFYTLEAGELKRHRFSNRYSPVGSRDGAHGPFFRGDDAEQVTAFVLESRRRVRKKIEKIHAGDRESDVQLVMPPTIACFRMTRRLVGRFTLAEEHVHQWFEDAIGLVGDWRHPGPVYAIPLRCLLGTKNHNLLTVGRCISVDNSAWDALRVFPPCVVTGEAAGTAAALAAAQGDCNLHTLERQSLQNRLSAHGVLLDPRLVAAADQQRMSNQVAHDDSGGHQEA